MTPSLPNTPLTEADIDRLEDFIFSDACSEDALDYLGIHGLLTALAISPARVPAEEWLDSIFDGTPGYANESEKTEIEGLLVQEFTSICAELNNEEAPELPCDLTLDDEDGLLSNWSQGFMEGVFLRESEWFAEDETRVAELLLPIMMASELFEEQEFADMRNNAKLSQQLCEEIPELLTDLYLHFRVPDEKGSAKKGGPKTGAQQQGKATSNSGKRRP